jgi:hypothetical protein
VTIEAAKYAVVEQLRGGRHIEIRSLKPDDRLASSMRSAASVVDRSTADSLA